MSLINLKKAGVLLLGAVSIGLALSAPAQAATSSSCLVSDILTGSCSGGGSIGGAGTFTFGDKQLSNLSGLNGTDTVVITDNADTTYQFQFNLNPTINSPASGAFTYDITIVGPNAGLGYTFQNAVSNITGGGLTPVGSTTVSSAAFAAPGSTTASIGLPQVLVAFNSGLQTASFTQSYNSAAGTISSLGLTLDQLAPTEVPGPLPILGAGAAFGFSRKLRKRISQSA